MVIVMMDRDQKVYTATQNSLAIEVKAIRNQIRIIQRHHAEATDRIKSLQQLALMFLTAEVVIAYHLLSDLAFPLDIPCINQFLNL